MILPNKFISFDSSIISKLYLISEVKEKNIPLIELYNILKKHFQSIDEFLYFIDVLYVLDYLKVNFEKEEVIIC